MKSTIHLLLFVSAFTFLGCEDDPITPNNPNGNNPVFLQNEFFLKKNGVSFNPGYTEYGSGIQNTIGVYAAETEGSNQNTYSFMMSVDIPVGEYDFETLYDDYGFWFTHSDENFNVYQINSGTFDVLQHDTVNDVIEASFAMEIENSNNEVHQITQGHFVVNY